MTRRQVAIVDYGLGNQLSVQRMIRHLGHRCVITDDSDVIARADLAILPGVGAFPAAMKMLHKKQLDQVLIERAHTRLPILGICLGMQLLTDISEEFGNTRGLGLIPGQVKALTDQRWHIGWNTIQIKQDAFSFFNGQDFFFNHSYVYEGADEFIIARVDIDQPRAAVICHDRVVGVQFHPEKSQMTGFLLLSSLIDNFCM